LTQGGSLKVVEYLGGKTVQRKAQRRQNVCRFCRALPGGHRASGRSAQEELYFEFREGRTSEVL
jgi:hypothetical protein